MAEDKEIKIELYPLHEQERAAAPGAFLLSLTEAKRIMNAAKVMAPVLHKYLYVDDDAIKTPEVQKQLRGEILTAFNSKRISRDSLIKVCEKVRQGKYWTYYLTRIEASTNSPSRDIYTLESNVTGVGGKDAITPDTYPAFYEGEPTIAKIAAIVGIPAGVLYIPEAELINVRALYRVIATTQEPDTGEDQHFIAVKSSLIIDVLSSVTKAAFDDMQTVESFNGDIFEITAANGVKISIDAGKFDRLAITSPGTDKLKTLLENYTLINGYSDNRFYITLEQYMTALGLKDRKEAAKKARRAVEILHAIRLSAEDVDGNFKGRGIVQEIDYNRGKGQQGSAITGKWTDAYLDHLRKTPQTAQQPRAILTIPDNRRNEYSFAKAFHLQKRRNVGKPNNIENRLRVSTLLNYSTLPEYESLQDRAQASQKIIDPFIKALDYLEEHGLFTYRFTYSRSEKKGDELTEADLNALYTDYHLFSSLLVEVQWTIEPNYTNLLEHKQKQIEKASTTTRRNRGRPRKKPIKEKG